MTDWLKFNDLLRIPCGSYHRAAELEKYKSNAVINISVILTGSRSYFFSGALVK